MGTALQTHFALSTNRFKCGVKKLVVGVEHDEALSVLKQNNNNNMNDNHKTKKKEREKKKKR